MAVPIFIKFDNNYYCYLNLNFCSIRYYSPIENLYLTIPIVNGELDKKDNYESCDITEFLINNSYATRYDGVKCFKNAFVLMDKVDSNISDKDFIDNYLIRIDKKLYNIYASDPIYRKIFNLSIIYKRFE